VGVLVLGKITGGFDVLLFCYRLSSKVSYLNIFTSNLSFLLVKKAPKAGLQTRMVSF
jgi:hypothetical protein